MPGSDIVEVEIVILDIVLGDGAGIRHAAALLVGRALHGGAEHIEGGDRVDRGLAGDALEEAGGEACEALLHLLGFGGAGVVVDETVVGLGGSLTEAFLVDLVDAALAEQAHEVHVDAESVHVAVELGVRHVGTVLDDMVGLVDDGLLGLADGDEGDAVAHKACELTCLVGLDESDMLFLGTLDILHRHGEIAHGIGVVEVEVGEVEEGLDVVRRLGISLVELGEASLVVAEGVGGRALGRGGEHEEARGESQE